MLFEYFVGRGGENWQGMGIDRGPLKLGRHSLGYMKETPHD